MVIVQSPNSGVQPISARVNEQGHLSVGGVDATELAKQFGTPLWVMDEQTIVDSIAAYKAGLYSYPGQSLVLYAGKAFLCLAMCHIIRRENIGLDVVSAGEMYTAAKAAIPPGNIYMHGNNKSEQEIRQGLEYGDVNIVVDNRSELEMVAAVAATLGKRARILLRIIPGIEPDTHQHIVTGHSESKFGTALEEVPALVELALSKPSIDLAGLHAHIGSQANELQPYFDYIDILVEMCATIKAKFGIDMPQLDVGGGLGIAYTAADQTVAIAEWSKSVSAHAASCLRKHDLPLPKLLIEPGRSIVGTAGVTLYRAGHKKTLPSGLTYVSVDGGMADNPRPITYQAVYTAAVANRMNAPLLPQPITLAGKYCESGDIIVKETYIPAESGDLIAVFGTGAYNYSMASNYNRTGRPACVLVSQGKAELIIERETNEDLLSHDRVPDRLR